MKTTWHSNALGFHMLYPFLDHCFGFSESELKIIVLLMEMYKRVYGIDFQ